MRTITLPVQIAVATATILGAVTLSATAAEAAPSTAPRCAASQLRADARFTGAGYATYYGWVAITNRGGTACSLPAIPRTHLLSRQRVVGTVGDFAPVGMAPDRPGRAVTLARGASSALWIAVSVSRTGHRGCPLTRVDHLAIDLAAHVRLTVALPRRPLLRVVDCRAAHQLATSQLIPGRGR